MNQLRNIVLKNSRYPAKTLWPDWPENVWNQPSGQVKMAGLASNWPDMGINLLPIAVFIAVLSDGLVRILQNGSLRHCRITVFIVKQSFSALNNMSYRPLTKLIFPSIGHSIGHFVLDSFIALKMPFYRTFSLCESIISYLTAKQKGGEHRYINRCNSAICLFDRYLIEVNHKSCKTPKPLYQSGFFSTLPLGQRDEAKILNTVLI